MKKVVCKKTYRRVLSLLVALALVVGIAPVSFVGALAPEDCIPLELDVNFMVEASVNDGVVYFSFTPEETGYYIFSSTENSFDTYGHLYDSEMNELAEDDDGGDANNFRLVYKLIAGNQYYFKSRPYETQTEGCYKVRLEKLPAVTAMSITEGDTLTGYLDDNTILSVTFEPAGAEEPVMWESDNEEVVTVNSNGYIMYVNVGTATVTATTETGFTDSIFITVIERPAATALVIGGADTEAVTGYVGIPQWMGFEFLPSGAAHESLTWSSNNTAVATVDNGYIQCLSPGIAQITATSSNGLTDSCMIQVTDLTDLTVAQPIEVQIFNNTEKMFRFVPTESGLYRIYASDHSNENRTVIQMMDAYMNDMGAAFDNAYLELQLEADQTYYIKTNYDTLPDGYNGIYMLNAVKLVPATGIAFDVGTEYTNYKGNTCTINVTYSPEFAITEAITWNSTDPDIVSVDGGTITLIAAGTATVTATTENGLTASCQITVKDFDTITLGEEKKITLDENTQAYYAFTPEEDGYYAFYSYDNDYDTYGYLLDEDLKELTSDDDSGDNNNFVIKYWLVGGQTYVLKARFYNEEYSGQFSVCVDEASWIVDMEILSMPSRAEYVRGCSADDVFYDGLKVKITWSDTSTTDWVFDYSWMVDGESIEYDTSSFAEDGKIVLTSGDAETVLQFTLVENPIESITFKDLFLYEGIDSHDWRFYIDSQLTEVQLKNGETGVIEDYSFIYKGVSYWPSNNAGNMQDQEHWTAGNTYEVTGTLLGVSATFNVTILENPIREIELTKLPDNITILQGGSLNLKGAAMRIWYQDGEYEDITFEDDYTSNYGREFYLKKIDRSGPVWFDGNPDTVGMQLADIKVFYQTVTVPVNIKENKIENISIRENKDKTIAISVTNYDETGFEMQIQDICYMGQGGENGPYTSRILTDKGEFTAVFYWDEDGFAVALVDYDKGDVIKSNYIPTCDWFEVAKLAISGPWSYNFSQWDDWYTEAFTGEVTANVIDFMAHTAGRFEDFYENYEWNNQGRLLIPGEIMKAAICKYFAVDEVDLTLSENYDPQKDAYMYAVPTEGGMGAKSGPDQISYNNGIWTVKTVWAGHEDEAIQLQINDEHRITAFAIGNETVPEVPPACEATPNGGTAVTYQSLDEALKETTGGTIKLLANVVADTVTLNPGVTLDLNGYTLDAQLLVVMNGAMILDGGKACAGGGMLKIKEENLVFARDNGQGVIPVWNGTDGYLFTKVAFQQMANPLGNGAAQYLFLPSFSNGAVTALMADGGLDNGLKFKVSLVWNNGQIQQLYTYEEAFVKQVFDGTYRWVFTLNVTGIGSIDDMVASAVVVSDCGIQATNAGTAIVGG